MFTGIVEEAGIGERIKPTAKSSELTVRAKKCGRGLKNWRQPCRERLLPHGCEKLSSRDVCGRLVQFDLLQETWGSAPIFNSPNPVRSSNLERPLRANAELGGHFVTGHIDGIGKIIRWERAGQDHVLDIAAPPEVMRYVIHKGSIAVDGISLTVA